MSRKKPDDDTLRDRRNLPIFIHSALDDMDLSPHAFRVYAHLARRAGKDNMAFPSYQSIGDHCFGKIFANQTTRRRRAMDAVKELLDAGLIRRTKRRNEGSGNMSNEYELTPSHEWEIPPGAIALGSANPPDDPGAIAPPSANSTPPSAIAPKGTPLEDTPISEGLAGQTANQQLFSALCWVLYDHQEYDLLTEEQRGSLNQTVGVLNRKKLGIDDLRKWYRDIWRQEWPGNTGRHPSIKELRGGIARVRATGAEPWAEKQRDKAVLVAAGGDL